MGHDLCGLELAAEGWLDALYPKFQRGVGCEELSRQTLAEEQVRGFFGIGRLDDRFLFPAPDPFQSPGDSERVACKLDRRRIGQEFSLSRYGGLDQPCKKHPGVSDAQEHCPKDQHRDDKGNSTFGIVVFAGGSNGHL